MLQSFVLGKATVIQVDAVALVAGEAAIVPVVIANVKGQSRSSRMGWKVISGLRWLGDGLLFSERAGTVWQETRVLVLVVRGQLVIIEKILAREGISAVATVQRQCDEVT